MSLVLFCPSIGLDDSLIERLAASVDYPIKYKVALNNGPTGALEKFRENHPDWYVKEPATGNLGCAGSWNWAAKMFPEAAILNVNEDAHFLPSYLEQICQTVDDAPNEPIIHLNSSNAYYAFVSTKAGRDKFGEFDENLWVAYYEDVEMRMRHRLAGVTKYVYALEGEPPMPHGKPQTGGMNYAALINACGLLNRAYMLRKWGTLDCENAAYQTPYKDHRLSIKEWIWYAEERAKRYPLWQTFLSLPNPSIYG